MILVFLLLDLLLAIAAGCAVLTAVVARRAERAVPPAGRFVTVDGVRLHYVEEGAGPPILMIHGLGSQLQTFTYALGALLPGYRLVMLGRPGAGYSQAAPSATLATPAGIIAGFLRALGIERALVVGHSLGGAVALALALDHPERVAGLALLGPATQPQDEPPEVLRGLAIRSDLVRRLAGWLVVTPLSLVAGPKQLAAVFAPDPVPADFGTRAGGLLQIRPAAFRRASRELVEAGGQLAAYAARQGALAMPVGVLYGTADNILDPALHGDGLAAKVPGCDLELIERAGHMVPISAPERTAAFIERIAGRAFAGKESRTFPRARV